MHLLFLYRLHFCKGGEMGKIIQQTASDQRHFLLDALYAAIPIMFGYAATGIACGILEQAIGLTVWMALVVSATFYSGVGQFMICNMALAGFPLVDIVTSTGFANSRQMLYSASLSKYFAHTSKAFTFFYAATVTDESFGISTQRFEQHRWDPTRALLLNLFCLSAWTLSNVVGVVIGNVISIPQAIAAFSMTCIFVFMISMQPRTTENLWAILASACAMILLKIMHITGPAVLISACIGVAVGLAIKKKQCRHTLLKNSVSASLSASDIKSTTNIKDSSTNADKGGDL